MFVGCYCIVSLMMVYKLLSLNGRGFVEENKCD